MASAPLARLLIVALGAQIGQVGVTLALLPIRAHDLGLAAGPAGAVVAVFYAAMLCLGGRVPAVLERFGARATLSVSLSLGLAASIGLAASTSLAALLAATTAMGVALTVRWIVMDTLIIGAAPAGHVGLVVGLNETLANVGIAAGTAMLAAFGSGALAVLAASVPPMSVALVASLGLARPAPPEPVSREPAGPPVAPPARILPVALALMAGAVEIAYLSFLPLGTPQSSGGLLHASVFALAGGVATPLTGRLADRYGAERMSRACLAIVAAGSVALLAGWPEPVVFALLFAVGGAATSLVTLALTMTADVQAPRRAAEVATIARLYTVGCLSGPLAAGGLASLGAAPGQAPAILAACLALGGLAGLFGRGRPVRARASPARPGP